MKKLKGYLLFCFLAILLFLGYRHYHSQLTFNDGNIVIKGQAIKLNIADVYLKQIKGLSGQNVLSNNEGMLFIYQRIGKHAIWMKGMKFSIDVVWIKQQKIVDIVSDIPIPIKNNDKLAIYKPKADNKCFLEVPAGVAKKYHWQIGDQVITIPPNICQ